MEQHKIEQLLIERISSYIDSAAMVDRNSQFSEFGLDSVFSGILIAELEVFLEKDLNPTLVWEYPSIHLLASHLSK